MRALLIVIVPVLVSLVACADPNVGVTSTTSASVHTAINPAATFERYRTFSFRPTEDAAPGYQTSRRSVEVERRMTPLISAALEAKGYRPTPSDGDLQISFSAGQRNVAIHESTSVNEGWMPDDQNDEYVEGSLVIDAIDRANERKVWHGFSQAKVNPDRIDEGGLRRAVGELMSKFPPAGANSNPQK